MPGTHVSPQVRSPAVVASSPAIEERAGFASALAATSVICAVPDMLAWLIPDRSAAPPRPYRFGMPVAANRVPDRSPRAAYAVAGSRTVHPLMSWIDGQVAAVMGKQAANPQPGILSRRPSSGAAARSGRPHPS